MNWEEHLEWLNSETIKELDAKISEITSEANEKAKGSMNNIHFILALAKTDKQKIKMIEKVEKEYNDNSIKTILPWRLKNRKEKYDEDPDAYEKEWHKFKEYAEKLKKEEFDS
jgi:hypothetical protein